MGAEKVSYIWRNCKQQTVPDVVPHTPVTVPGAHAGASPPIPKVAIVHSENCYGKASFGGGGGGYSSSGPMPHAVYGNFR